MPLQALCCAPKPCRMPGRHHATQRCPLRARVVHVPAETRGGVRQVSHSKRLPLEQRGVEVAERKHDGPVVCGGACGLPRPGLPWRGATHAAGTGHRHIIPLHEMGCSHHPANSTPPTPMAVFRSRKKTFEPATPSTSLLELRLPGTVLECVVIEILVGSHEVGPQPSRWFGGELAACLQGSPAVDRRAGWPGALGRQSRGGLPHAETPRTPPCPHQEQGTWQRRLQRRRWLR